MTYKTILVHLDAGARTESRLVLADGLAERFDAHLVGLFAPAEPKLPPYVEAAGGPVLRETMAKHRAEAEAKTRAAFDRFAKRNGGARAEWRAASGEPSIALRTSARYADLVVAGQPEPGDPGETRGLADELALFTGRPVLFVPYAGKFSAVGQRVLVAWDAGREAARAVSDALPFLRQAQAVEVCAFDPDRGRRAHGEVPGADVGLWLARHGVKVQAARQSGAGFEVGSQILSRAADFGADLIVMGAYGHARVRELVLGGVTRTLLESMTVPVLMSH